MTLIKATNKGFFACVNDTARQISQCIKNNEEWYIKWGGESLYYDAVREGNVWEYYFKQSFDYCDCDKVTSDYIELYKFKEDNFRKTMNFIYSNYFKVNEETENILRDTIKTFENSKVLGLHVRRTDKFLIGQHGTTYQHSPVDLEKFKHEVDNIKDGYDYIYLATDCHDACEYFKSIYGEKLIYNKNCIRSKDNIGIHNNHKNVSGYIKGLNVVTDAILLSKSKFLIRSNSNVSMASLYMNVELEYLNMNEKYLGDNEDDLIR